MGTLSGQFNPLRRMITDRRMGAGNHPAQEAIWRHRAVFRLILILCILITFLIIFKANLVAANGLVTQPFDPKWHGVEVASAGSEIWFPKTQRNHLDTASSASESRSPNHLAAQNYSYPPFFGQGAGGYGQGVPPSGDIPLVNAGEFVPSRSTIPPTAPSLPLPSSGVGGLVVTSPEVGIPTPPGPVAEIHRLDNVEILAQVGSSWILASDIRPGVAEVMEERKGTISPREWPVVERMATVRILDQMIETRLLYLAARQRIPAERWAEIEKRLTAAFDNDELPRRVKEGKYASVDEYKAQLERLGSSLEQERRLFIERAIASQWLHHAIGPIPEPTPAELLAYYRDHVHEFETPAQARWEEVWVNLPRYSTGEEAWNKLAVVGNMLLEGLPLEEALARQPAQPPRCEGTRRDWTQLDSPLIDPMVRQAVCHLPVGAWSEIFRSGNRLYIVRVLERQEAVRIPFTEAQAQIRKRIVDERRRERIRNYLADLRAQTTVWTIFDGDPQVAAWREMWARPTR